jgi:hypothetical protein
MGSEETMTGSRAGVKLSVGWAGAFVCLPLWIAVLSNAGMASGGSASRSTEPPLPADAAGVGLAFSDLASAGGGKLPAATDTYASRGYFAVARLTAAGVLDKSFRRGRLHEAGAPVPAQRCRAARLGGRQAGQQDHLGGVPGR